MTAGDLDGDQDLDLLATATQRNLVQLLLNSGEGTFSDGGQIQLSHW